MNDVADEIEDVEEIADLMLQILTEIQPQIVECPVPVPQETVQEIVSDDDDREEETSQSGAEPAEKEMINDADTLLSVETTGKKARRFHRDH